jgi:hypothetical protein
MPPIITDLHVVISYRANRNNLCAKTLGICHTDPMFSPRNARALISIDVFLRLTAMDVCCGPPASLL